MDKLTLEHIAAYLPYGVKVVFFEKTYYGGVNENSYKDKKGEHAYTRRRIGTITGYKNGFALSTIGKFDLSELNTTYTGAHVTHKFEKRLLLRPLSDLTKPINWGLSIYKFISLFEVGDTAGFIYEFDNGNIKLIDELKTIATYNLHHDINYLPYPVVQMMFEFHFDVFGLIDRGLAIDLNNY